jgi:predicted Zn-dependent protease
MSDLLDAAARRARSVAIPCAGWTVRLIDQVDEVLAVRRDVVEPCQRTEDVGAMVTVECDGAIGYAATPELSASGLRAAFENAAAWAGRCAGAVVRAARLPQPSQGSYRSQVLRRWDSESRRDKNARLLELSAALAGTAPIVDWSASLWSTHIESVLIGSDGGAIRQGFDYLVPMAGVTASDHRDSQTRTFGGHAYARQGGLEVAEQVGFWSCGERLREQVLALLVAEDCPRGTMPVVLAPDQMILQIHESIGHPIELDRILGDERNYAGGSFVALDMFGSYRYGADCLNVTFDPTVAGELATYAYDDEGQGADRVHVIRDGILVRPLGGARSSARAGISGAPSSRANGWNRPPIDRIGNLNVEPGDATFEELVGGVESGVYMETNRSWSIDDSRNKFQFGCEYGRRIRDGALAEVVKNPNYRGVSATFWRNLECVGNAATVEVLGTPFCGKGEPNQVMRVGHSSPACRFRDVDVFGGD